MLGSHRHQLSQRARLLQGCRYSKMSLSTFQRSTTDLTRLCMCLQNISWCLWEPNA